jgi:hypothetical protein
MTGWESFFPRGTPVLALPNWENPRLYVPAGSFSERWKNSAFYPASRLQGRLYRMLLRTRAATDLTLSRAARTEGWPLGEFARDVLPGSVSATVLVGEPSPVQKVTARLCDPEGRVLGYVKYAEEGPARRRLRQEYRVLSRLPVGVGPDPLKYGLLGDGEALVSTPLPGRHLPANLTTLDDVSGFLRRLVVSRPLPVEAHPWTRDIRGKSELDLGPWLEALSGRDWPVVIQHGDLAPWNVLRGPDGALGAVDWECGSLESIPHLDLTHYILQVSFLVLRWSPLKAVRFAVGYLTDQGDPSISPGEARTLTRLAAYDLHLKHREDGYARDAEVGEWLRTIWEGET